MVIIDYDPTCNIMTDINGFSKKKKMPRQLTCGGYATGHRKQLPFSFPDLEAVETKIGAHAF